MWNMIVRASRRGRPKRTKMLEKLRVGRDGAAASKYRKVPSLTHAYIYMNEEK